MRWSPHLLTRNGWIASATPLGCRFGLYEDKQLVGITGIIAGNNYPEEAYMTQSYIREAHRGKKLSRMLYKARIEWAKNKGINYLVIGHRQGNPISRNANQRFGFVYTHQELREWPDGHIEPMLYYRLLL